MLLKMRKRAVVIIAFLMPALLPAISLAGAPEAYQHLKALAGNWEAELPGFGKITSNVRVVSNGKAIEEVIGTPSDNEISVYTLNVDKILLTHYCAMTPDGHQVRLQTSRIGPEIGHLNFNFVSATNLHSAAAPHMRQVIMTVSDRDHYSEQWVKTENGKQTIFNLSFARR